MCDVLEVSRSGYYDWKGRPPSDRALDDARIMEILEQAWKESGGSYGAPRLIPEVNERLAAAGHGLLLGNRRGRRLMRRKGISGQSRRRWRPKGCTERDPSARPAPDLCQRDFSAEGPNLKWVSDITQIDTLAGPCWAAVVTDVWSRRIVGWSIADHHRAELILDAF
jgi:putative transposase